MIPEVRLICEVSFSEGLERVVPLVQTAIGETIWGVGASKIIVRCIASVSDDKNLVLERENEIVSGILRSIDPQEHKASNVYLSFSEGYFHSHFEVTKL